jgi:hypothetical protein
MRYQKRSVLKNAREEYKDLLLDRNRKFFLHYDTAILRHPSVDEIVGLTIQTEVWKRGTRLFKLADKYYGNPELWWVIAWYNQRPTEGFFELGDIVEIPLPLNQVLKYLGV